MNVASLLGRARPLLVGLALLGSLAACRAEEGVPEGDSAPLAPAARDDKTSFREDEAGVLLVWIAEDGEFHTSTKTHDVPQGSREVVRVLFEDRPSGSADTVLVTNLDERRPDGAYALRGFSRKHWESRGLAQRKARVSERTPEENTPSQEAGALDVDAIVYGAAWCKPCHLAEAYLKKSGARVVKKDIEEDPGAGSEMRQKLKAVGLPGASIPVLDVGGTVLVGFSPSAVDAALRRATAGR